MNFFKKLLSSNSGVSSKRFISLIASISVIIIAFVDMFTTLTITDYVFQGLVWLAVGGITGVASEKFMSRNKDKEEPINENERE